jgi:hypothetical protein
LEPFSPKEVSKRQKLQQMALGREYFDALAIFEFNLSRLGQISYIFYPLPPTTHTKRSCPSFSQMLKISGSSLSEIQRKWDFRGWRPQTHGKGDLGVQGHDAV